MFKKLSLILILLLVTSIVLDVDVSDSSRIIPKIIESGSRDKKLVALTIDDGPHLEYTPLILDILKEYNIKVTFFIVGKMAEKYPFLVKRIYEEGHEIGNHTYSHPMFTNLMKKDIVDELEKTRAIIKKICGRNVYLFRPPHGRYDERIVDIAWENHYITALWSLYTMDYGCNNSMTVINTIKRNVHPGAIIMCHSGVNPTLKAMPHFIYWLKMKGYRFVTMTEMIKQTYTAKELYAAIPYARN